MAETVWKIFSGLQVMSSRDGSKNTYSLFVNDGHEPLLSVSLLVSKPFYAHFNSWLLYATNVLKGVEAVWFRQDCIRTTTKYFT